MYRKKTKKRTKPPRKILGLMKMFVIHTHTHTHNNLTTFLQVLKYVLNNHFLARARNKKKSIQSSTIIHKIKIVHIIIIIN